MNKNIILMFLGWRFLLFWVAFFSLKIIPVWGNRFPYASEYLISTELPYWIWQWGNFDGVHYLSIAKNLYEAVYVQAFFPLFPLTIRFLGSMFMGNLIAGFILSNLFFLLSLIMFSKVLNIEGYKKEDIYWILIFVLFFPTSFYFGAIYTESLFLLLVLVFFYFLKKNKWGSMAFTGFMASAVKLLGVSLTAIVAVDIIKKIRLKKTVNLMEVLSLLIIPLGLIIYMYYLQVKFDDFLMFWHSQPAFGAERSGSSIVFPPQVIFRYLKIILTVSPSNLAFFTAVEEIVAFLGAIVLIIIGYYKRIGIYYLIFSAVVIIVPSLTGTLSSMPRYILIALPIYMVLGTIKKMPLKLLILGISILLFLINSTLFLRGYWVS